MRWDDAARIDERDLNLWYREARMANLIDKARRINEMRLAINGDHEAVNEEFDRINFAVDQLSPQQITAEEQRASIESLKEVFK